MSIAEMLSEAWHTQAHRAFERYLDEHDALDPIAAERMKASFIEGFMAAGRPPKSESSGLVVAVPIGIPGILELARRLAPYVGAFGIHGQFMPGDMMLALGIVIASIGRQVHPQMTNTEVFEVFAREALVVMPMLDKKLSDPEETRH